MQNDKRVTASGSGWFNPRNQQTSTQNVLLFIPLFLDQLTNPKNKSLQIACETYLYQSYVSHEKKKKGFLRD